MKGVTSISKSTVKDLMKLPSEITKLTDFDIYVPTKIGKQLPNGWTYVVDYEEGHYEYKKSKTNLQ